MFFIMLGIVVCSAVTFTVIDQKCLADSTRWLPDYPKATLVSQEYDFLRPFGIGETVRQLYSPDAANVVRRWYGEAWAKIGEENPDLGLAQPGYIVSEADSTGSTIMLYSECASR